VRVCIAGKNDIACNVLRDLVGHVGSKNLVVICNKDDTGVNTWQESLRFVAQTLGVVETTLAELYDEQNLLFVSVEFDRIIKPEKFSTNLIYNIHFSALPKHRGVATTIWPILQRDFEVGVTFHEIDPGIDTGRIVEQVTFSLPDHYTARTLYFRYMDEGRKLVVDQVRKILDSEKHPISSSQDESKATYHSRNDLDFKHPETHLDYTEQGVICYLRAFHFFEYQLPVIQGHRIWAFRLTDSSSDDSPGHIRLLGCHDAVLSTSGNDIALELDPYHSLFSWVQREGDLPDGFQMARVPDLNLQNKSGWSALMIACYHSNIEAVKLLIGSGADVNASNKRGTTPLMYARSGELNTGSAECFQYLLTKGADASAKDVYGRDVAWYLGKDSQTNLSALLS